MCGEPACLLKGVHGRRCNWDGAHDEQSSPGLASLNGGEDKQDDMDVKSIRASQYKYVQVCATETTGGEGLIEMQGTFDPFRVC